MPGEASQSPCCKDVELFSVPRRNPVTGDPSAYVTGQAYGFLLRNQPPERQASAASGARHGLNAEKQVFSPSKKWAFAPVRANTRERSVPGTPLPVRKQTDRVRIAPFHPGSHFSRGFIKKSRFTFA
jgi:hypothetical protein